MVVGRDQVEGEEGKEQLKILVALENSMPQANSGIHVENPVSVGDGQVRARKRGVWGTKAKNGYQLPIAKRDQIRRDGESDRRMSGGETQKAL